MKFICLFPLVFLLCIPASTAQIIDNQKDSSAIILLKQLPVQSSKSNLNNHKEFYARQRHKSLAGLISGSFITGSGITLLALNKEVSEISELSTPSVVAGIGMVIGGGILVLYQANRLYILKKEMEGPVYEVRTNGTGTGFYYVIK